MNNTPNKFKLILTGVFGFFVILGLIAFSTYKSTSSTNNNTEIKVWGTIDKKVFDSYINKYQQDKNIQFKLTYTYKSPDKIDSELVEAIATGKAPDSILVPQNLIKRYLDKVYLITYPERSFKDTFVQESELYIQPSGVFALPFFIDPLVMYWNRDMFSTASIALPPSTWAEFPLLAQKISQNDSNANITKSAVSFGEFKNVNNAKALLSTLIMQAGNPIVSEDTNGLFKSILDVQSSTDIMVPADSALQFFTDYSNPKKSVYSWNRSLPSSKDSFLSEDLATYFGFASEYQDIKDKNSNLNFDVATMPQIVNAKANITYGTLYGFAILKSSQNVTQATSLLSLLVGADSVSTLLQFMTVAPARRDLVAIGSINPVQSIVFNSSLISRGWIDPDSNQTDQIFQNMVENVTTGRMNIQDSVSKASKEINNLLQ